jgi:putative ATP-binding cassette transporter
VNEGHVTVSRRTLHLLFNAIRSFLKSHVGGRARLLLACLIALMFCINGMNVANSYVGRWFMSAIESRDSAGFSRFARLGEFVQAAEKTAPVDPHA